MKKALIGYGGHAKEVMSQMGVKLTCFVDDKYVVYGTKKHNQDLELPYPDLSKYEIYTK
jgi:hypothetical protein